MLWNLAEIVLNSNFSLKMTCEKGMSSFRYRPVSFSMPSPCQSPTHPIPWVSALFRHCFWVCPEVGSGAYIVLLLMVLTRKGGTVKALIFFFFLTISLIFSLNSYCLQMWAFFCLQFASLMPKILNPVLTNQLLTFMDPETPPPNCKAGYSFSNKRVILGSKTGVFCQTQTLLSSLFFQLSEIHSIYGRSQRLPRIMLYFQPPTSIYVMFPSERQILALLSTLCPGQRAIAWDSSHGRLRRTKKSLAHRALSEGSFAWPGSSAACLCCLWSQQGWG